MEFEHAEDFGDRKAPEQRKSKADVAGPNCDLPKTEGLKSRQAADRTNGVESKPAKSNTERLRARECPKRAIAGSTCTKLRTGKKLAT